MSEKEKVLSVKTLWSAEETTEPDNLGEGDGYVIKIYTPCEFKRGLLMMSGPEGFFIPATRAGALEAEELCVLADDLGYDTTETNIEGENETEISEYTSAIAYFEGRLNGDAIILKYETEDDDHEELLAELSEKFRKQRLHIL